MTFYQVILEGRYLIAVCRGLEEAVAVADVVRQRTGAQLTMKAMRVDVPDLEAAFAASLVEYPEAIPGAASPVGRSRLHNP